MSLGRLLNELGVWVVFSSILPFEGWDSGRRKMDDVNCCVHGVVLKVMVTMILDRHFEKLGLLM